MNGTWVDVNEATPAKGSLNVKERRQRGLHSTTTPPCRQLTKIPRSCRIILWGVFIDSSRWHSMATASGAFLASRGVTPSVALKRYTELLDRAGVRGDARRLWLSGLRSGFRRVQ